MHILHLEASPGWGGQEIRVLREAQGMRKRGHEVIFGVMRGGKLVLKARALGFVVYELNFKRLGWLSCFFRLLKIIRSHRIDLVNTHSSLDAWIGGIAARAALKTVVRTRHLSTPIKGKFNGKMVYGRLADFVVTTCESILPMVCEKSGKKRALCRSVPTGVEPASLQYDEADKENFRKGLGLKPNDWLVGTACFMRSWKGIDDFLEAARLLKHLPDIKWTIIGGGHEETYRRRALEKGVEGIVHFTGHLENPFAAIAALDCFALLSTAHEGVSQAILQAAYLSKPLIATKIGGLQEVCIDRETGFSVDPFAPDQVARAVLALKDHRELGRQLGINSRKLVEEKFTFSRTLDQMEEIYSNMLKIYRNGLKNREFEEEAAQIFASGASGHCQRQGASEDQKFAAKLTQSKTDSSDYFGI